MKLILFDIDGTLIHSGGAGNRAFSRALETTFQISGGLNGVRLDGKTDLQIVREVFDRQGLDLDVSLNSSQVLFRKYADYLREELDLVGRSYQVLPGVKDLLAFLDRDPAFLLGLATGNIEVGARLKLERGGLSHYFPLGGYGSDSESRTELIQTAIDRARKQFPVDSTFVIGDTPRDIQHGHLAGAKVVAVASGHYRLSDLRDHQPDLCVASLEPAEPVIEFLSQDK